MQQQWVQTVTDAGVDAAGNPTAAFQADGLDAC